MPGTTDRFIIGDSDALIAVISQADAHAKASQEALRTIIDRQLSLIFPITTIIETITAIQRKIKNPELIGRVIKRIEQGGLALEAVDSELYKEALSIFDPRGSKQNTLFDAIVAATAHRYRTKYIFSFDGWYKKLGFTLAKDL